jgi:hypothetical protein
MNIRSLGYREEEVMDGILWMQISLVAILLHTLPRTPLMNTCLHLARIYSTFIPLIVSAIRDDLCKDLGR